MIRLGLLVLSLLIGGGVGFARVGGEFQVIVHADNPTRSMERRHLAEIFLKNSTYWPDHEVILPVDLKPGADVRKMFSEIVLNRSVSLVRTYWQQRIFAGRGVPPPELNSDAEVIEYVRTHRGAIGYISGGSAPRNVRIVTVN